MLITNSNSLIQQHAFHRCACVCSRKKKVQTLRCVPDPRHTESPAGVTSVEVADNRVFTEAHPLTWIRFKVCGNSEAKTLL